MCKYCNGIIGKKIDISKSPCMQETQPDEAMIIQLKDDAPGLVLFKNGLAQGTIQMKYCHICGRAL